MISTLTTSQIGTRVLRETPSGADNASHALLLQGGFLHQQAAGIYSFTPLLYRVEQKVSEIIAEEITLAGGSQIRLPILQSADLWKQTGRWQVYAHERLMFQFEDRKGRDFGLAPTAEEAVCDLAKHLVVSPSQLPLILFQQNHKFRDELRPRSGLLRAREFVMMDAYSFDVDEAGLDEAYEKMREAYQAILARLGVRYITVAADSGAIGGTGSEEFMAISEIGEDIVLFNDGYAANLEQTRSTPPEAKRAIDEEMRIVDTPGVDTPASAASFLKVDETATVSSELYNLNYPDRTEHALVLMRGDGTVNPIKLANHFGALNVTPAKSETVQNVTGASVDCVGPIGLAHDVNMVADLSLKGLTSLALRCGQPGKHAVGVKPGRDFPLPEFVDLRSAQEGEIAPNGKPLQQCRGIEVGHIFKLGDKYSKALRAGITDKDQNFRNFQMGCYGIGTTRMISAIVDQNLVDDKEIVWPLQIAPFHVHIIPLRGEYLEDARKLADDLAARGIESLLEDRGGSAGSLLNDSDILGLPLRIVLGRDFAQGKVEMFNRIARERDVIAVETAADRLGAIIAEDRTASAARRAEILAS